MSGCAAGGDRSRPRNSSRRTRPCGGTGRSAGTSSGCEPPDRGSSMPRSMSAIRLDSPASSNGWRRLFGEPVGLIHGAGLIHDKLIRDKTLESFDRVLGTKLDGA